MKPKKRLVFLAYSLSGGGLESQIACLTDVFAEEFHDAKLLLWNDDIGFDTKMPIINLEKKFGKKTLVSKIRKYLYIKWYIKRNKIDILIDQRHKNKPWLELFLSIFVLNVKTFSAVHSSDLKAYGFKNKYLVKYIFNKQKHLVCVSKCIVEKIKREFPFLKNVHQIYNVFEQNNTLQNEDFDLNYKYILFSGRVNGKEKQVDKLINAYAKSKVYQSNIHLVLLGWDEKSKDLHQLAENFNLQEFIHFIPFKSNINAYYKNALFTVLCSKFEGLGMTLIESLANGTPVISFDCPCGPSEIITHNYNGFLIENQNFNKLADAFHELIADEKKLKYFEANARSSVEKFSKNEIMKSWIMLINSD